MKARATNGLIESMIVHVISLDIFFRYKTSAAHHLSVVFLKRMLRPTRVACIRSLNHQLNHIHIPFLIYSIIYTCLNVQIRDSISSGEQNFPQHKLEGGGSLMQKPTLHYVL
jgi:hypothetical protein